MAFISKLKAGDFNIRINLKEVGETHDDFGGVVKYNYTTTTVWANKNVKTLRDVQEKFEGEQLQSYGRFVFTIRYNDTTKEIKSDWVIEDVETGEGYDILGFVIDPRKEFIEIFTKQNLATDNPY